MGGDAEQIAGCTSLFGKKSTVQTYKHRFQQVLCGGMCSIVGTLIYVRLVRSDSLVNELSGQLLASRLRGSIYDNEQSSGSIE